MTARVGPREARPLDGEVLCRSYGAVALWVGNPKRRLMGFVIEHVDRVSAALDEMARLDQEMGLR
jgi:hypothetical protein